MSLVDINNTLAKYGWKAEESVKNYYVIYNAKNVSVATAQLKGSRYVIKDTSGQKLLDGNKDIAGGIEKVATKYFYAQDRKNDKGHKEAVALMKDDLFLTYEKALEIVNKEAEDKPAPTIEPVQGEFDFEPTAEKKKRTLSYAQQLTLLKGRLRAKKGKLTQDEVIAEGLKLQETRKAAAQGTDEKRDSTKRLSPTPENLLRWANNPADFDLIGVDTFERTDANADYKKLISKQKIFNLYGIKA